VTLMVLDDPLDPYAGPDPSPEKASLAPQKPPLAEPPPRFTVLEGAERHVAFWLVILGIMGVLALVALVGFGPR